MVEPTRSFRDLFWALLMGVATTPDAARVPADTLSYRVDVGNGTAVSPDMLASLSSQDADCMSLKEVLTA